MVNYDFRALNDKEFEALSIDLLRSRERANIERFTSGRDGGVDGRFYHFGNVVIQAKHFARTGYKGLLSKLKSEEVTKVKNINPSRYILVTSVGLTPGNKDEIKLIFHPYIINASDIIGRDEVNDLLKLNPGVEVNNFKLWLSSSNVLITLLNNGNLQKRDFLIRDAVKESSKFVQTSQLIEATKVLDDNRLAIITGLPGVGKTTLAKQLMLMYRKNGYDVYHIDGSISEVESMYLKSKKQFFYFDDFLGANYLEIFSGNTDSKIVNFMKRIVADKKKRMILTTRTNILNKAKSLSDVFNHEKIDQKEYEINVSQLTDLEKASMLYNHVWHGLGSDELSDVFFENKNYWRVIKHKNFNPRLISYITDKDRLSGIRKNTYWDYIQNALDNPEVIWDHCFNNQTPDEVLDLVCLIVFSGNNIYEGDCVSALKRVFKIKYSSQYLSKVNKIDSYIRESLKSTVTRTLVLHKSKRYPILSPFNPSVSDYIINRFSKNEDTLFLYFDALRTISSLNSLFALRKNRTISSEVFLFVFEPILNRLKGCSLDGYSVRLYALVINSDMHEKQKLSIVDHNAFLNINENFLTYDQEVGECLYWLALKRREFFSESFVKSIINYALRSNWNSTLSHEDCVPLAKLINLFPEVKGDEETVLIINAIKTYWEANIEDYILNSRRIQDIHDDLPNAGDIAFDIIKDMVKEYDLPFVDDDLESIFDNVRIDYLYPDDDDLSDRSGRVSDYEKIFGKDSARDIDDLFTR